MLRAITFRAAPDPALVARTEAEVTEALRLFEAEGWIDDPASYHREPPAPSGVRERRTRSGNVRYTKLTWLDGYEVRAEEPGAERYRGYRSNRLAHLSLLEHRDDRPWLVCVHGFGMGSSGLDLRAFRGLHLHRDLGMNVAFVTLPFHGKRKIDRSPLPKVPGIDVLDNLHAFEQAIWDVRQALALVRARTSEDVGLMGLSLGGGIAATVASIEEPHAVALLVPAVDLPTLFADAAARAGGDAVEGLELLERSRALMAPVSPLSLTPRVPVERRAIVAGTLDKFARPSTQAAALWRHWDEPALHWYHGGHVSLFWSPRAKAAIDGFLGRVGLTADR
jgi:alpha-beta hydrolase superfamily lysophospholipase